MRITNRSTEIPVGKIWVLVNVSDYPQQIEKANFENIAYTEKMDSIGTYEIDEKDVLKFLSQNPNCKDHRK